MLHAVETFRVNLVHSSPFPPSIGELEEATRLPEPIVMIMQSFSEGEKRGQRFQDMSCSA